MSQAFVATDTVLDRILDRKVEELADSRRANRRVDEMRRSTPRQICAFD